MSGAESKQDERAAMPLRSASTSAVCFNRWTESPQEEGGSMKGLAGHRPPGLNLLSKQADFLVQGFPPV